MCCRYHLIKDDAKALLEKLGVLIEAGALPPTRYNVPPGDRILAVRTHASGNARELASVHWGLTPSWARDPAKPVVNARAESLADKPSFRDAFRSRRCLIPASGFYEWKVSGRVREPWLFRLRDGQPFALAGLWETWLAPDGTAHESCAVVTTAPNTLMAPIHHRMPAILADSATYDIWLDPRITSPDTLAPLLCPFPADALTALAVSPHVNDIRHDDPACLTPASEQQLAFGL